MIIADTLSRAPHIPKQDIDLTDDIEIMVHAIVENLPISSERLQELKSSTKTDCELQAVMKMIKGPHIRNKFHQQSGIFGTLEMIYMKLKEQS